MGFVIIGSFRAGSLPAALYLLEPSLVLSFALNGLKDVDIFPGQPKPDDILGSVTCILVAVRVYLFSL